MWHIPHCQNWTRHQPGWVGAFVRFRCDTYHTVKTEHITNLCEWVPVLDLGVTHTTLSDLTHHFLGEWVPVLDVEVTHVMYHYMPDCRYRTHQLSGWVGACVGFRGDACHTVRAEHMICLGEWIPTLDVDWHMYARLGKTGHIRLILLSIFLQNNELPVHDYSCVICYQIWPIHALRFPLDLTRT